jgi:hypothetical protein
MTPPPESSRARRLAATSALLLLALFNVVAVDCLAGVCGDFLPWNWAERGLLQDVLFLIEGLALCAFTPRMAGLSFGDLKHWRRYALPLAIVFALPPLLVATVYAHLTSRPFHGAPWHLWLVQSPAQDLLFMGFIYGWLGRFHGEPSRDWRGGLHPVMCLTPLCFAAWHWPNVLWLSDEYMAFQFAYTFLGGWWMLHMRRWTGSVLPGIANHVLVNWLAAVV